MVVDLSGYRAPRRPLDRRALMLWSGSCVVLVTLCFLFADRPIATWSHDILHRPRFAVLITELDAAWWTTGLALAVLLAALALRVTGRTFPMGLRIAVGAASATLLATLGVVLLKYAFGRLWPETWVHGNPSWIGMHQYGFVPFHGGQGYGSFPPGIPRVLPHPAPCFGSACRNGVPCGCCRL